MLTRLRNLLQFWLERLLLRGMHVRLLFMACIIGLVAWVGGTLIYLLEDSHSGAHPVWWAFLRLTDPGYLGDDEGLARRAVSTVLTVLGYVLFMGSLVAIMTQWLNETVRRLEAGLTPIVQKGHVLVVGWTSRTSTIVHEMFVSEGRIQRFLSRKGSRRLHLVMMVEDLNATFRYELRERIGQLWREELIVMRSGSPLHLQHLRRVDFLRAAAILIPSEDLGPREEASDARTIKTLLSIGQYSGERSTTKLPLVVTEIFDARKVAVARRAYRGPLEVVSSDLLIGRLMALTVLHPGLSRVFEEMLTYGDGSEIHISDADGLEGLTADEVAARFPNAVLLGFVRPAGRSFAPRLCVASGDRLAAGERLVVLATQHEDALTEAAPPAPEELPELEPVTQSTAKVAERILVLGWSDRVPDLIAELAAHHPSTVHVDVLSSMASDRRAVLLATHSLGKAVVRNLEGSVSSASVVARQLAEGYDAAVLMASDFLGTDAQSDARTIMTYMLVVEALETLGRRTHVVLELMDDGNRSLIDAPGVEVLVSPRIIGRVLAHVTLRQELGVVYEELFDAEGPVLTLRDGSRYGVVGRALTFRQLAMAVAHRGDVLLGILPAGGALSLNPPKQSRWRVAEEDDLVVLAAPLSE